MNNIHLCSLSTVESNITKYNKKNKKEQNSATGHINTGVSDIDVIIGLNHFMVTSKLIVYRIKSDFAVMYAFTWQFEIKKEQQSSIMSFLFVWNDFIRKQNIAKSRDPMSDCDRGQTSTAYRRICIHVLCTR